MQRQRNWYKEGLFALALAGTLSLGQIAIPSLALAEVADGDVVASSQDQNNNETQNETLSAPNETPATTPVAAPAETPAVTPTTEPTTDPVATPAPEQLAAPADDPADQLAEPTDDPADQLAEPADDPSDQVADPLPEDPIENGTVAFIESGMSGNETQVIDAKGGKSDNGTNIQTYKLNNTAAQKYEFEKAMKAILDGFGEPVTNGDGEIQYEEDRDENGNIFYWIKRAGTDMVLTVVDNLGVKGTNVALYEKDPSLDGQKWLITDMGDGLYKISSKLTNEADGKELVLDIDNAKKASGTNIKVWTSNNNQAQRFSLINTQVPVSNVEIESGAYIIATQGDTNLVGDIQSGSTANKANFRLYKNNNTAAQAMVIASDGEGYYTIGVLKSGKVLDVEGGSMLPGTNVSQYTYNGSDAQKWSIQQNADGSYSFISKKNGLYLNIQDGTLSSGTNLRVWRPMGDNAAQKFVLTRSTKADQNALYVGDEVSATGIYTITPVANSSFVFDVKGGSKDPGGLIQLWNSNDTQAQKFQVELVGDNEYLIRTAASGDFLTDMGSAGAQLQQAEGSTWRILWDNTGYFVLQSTMSDLVIEVADANYAKGTAIQTADNTGKANQHFLFTAVDLVAETMYYLTLNSGNTLDVASGSTAAGANVRIWNLNKSEAQRFHVVKVGKFYQLINANSNKAVQGGGAQDSDGYHNVTQENTNTTNKAQLWKIVVGNDGFIEFVNVATGKNLFSRGTDKTSNVVEKNLKDKAVTDNINGRSWKLVVATGWYKKNGHWFYTSDDSRAHFDMDYDSKGKSTGNYDILYTIWRYVNGKTSGSNKCFYSKTGYLICSSWDNCYIGIFKGKAKVTTAENWQPLFGLNCANGLPSKIEAQARIDKPGSTWKWDPNWDRNLGEGNTNIKNLPEGSEWAYYLDYKPGESVAKGSYNWVHSRKAKVSASEKWFTSVKTTLGYHTYTGKESAQVGRHLSYGCQRVAEKWAKWIYDNIGLGTRCLQRTNKRLTSK